MLAASFTGGGTEGYAPPARQDRVGFYAKASHNIQGERQAVQYVEIAIALAGALGLAWIADLLTGRRGLGGTILVALVSGACGAFLAVRVFAVATLSDWEWLPWAFAAVVLSLVAFFLFRSKR
jgi:DNA segregation ATPase FtsK/SpoIIIE-like protein